MLAVWCYAVAAVVSLWNPSVSASIWLISLLLIYVLIAGIGLLIQRFCGKYRSLLVKTKGPDRSDIVRFAFTFGRLAQIHLHNFHTKVRGTEYQIDSSAEPCQNQLNRVPRIAIY